MLKDSKQIILRIGAAGGSITLYGLKNRAGRWLFTLGTNETTMLSFDETLSPDKVTSTSKTVDTWEDALKLLDRYPWTSLYPLEVHPEFRQLVWEAVLERGKTLDKSQVDHWLRYLEKWCELCFTSAKSKRKSS
jgi:hypothetical protein